METMSSDPSDAPLYPIASSVAEFARNLASVLARIDAAAQRAAFSRLAPGG